MKSREYLESLVEWQHDERMSALFYLEDVDEFRGLTADEKLVVTNKVNFWKTTIPRLLSCEDSPSRLSCSLSWIEEISTRKGLRPRGLVSVFERLCQEVNWMCLQDYLRRRPTITSAMPKHSTWIGTFMSWAWSRWKVDFHGKRDDLNSRVYTVPSSEILRVGRILLEKHPIVYYTDRIRSMEEMRQELVNMGYINPVDIEMIFMELKHDKLCDFFVFDDGQSMVKIMENAKDPIGQLDRGLFRLKATRMKVQRRLEDLKMQVETCKGNILKELSKEDRQTALLYLRKKKWLEKSLSKKHHCDMTLEELWLRIQTAETDADVMKAYEVGSESLKNFMKEYGVTVDRVEDVMETLRETMIDQDLLDSTWQSTMVSQTSAEEEEEMKEVLEPDLDQFEEMARKEHLLIEHAPSVPKNQESRKETSSIDISERLDRLHMTENA
jgi:hypothetical protein